MNGRLRRLRCEVANKISPVSLLLAFILITFVSRWQKIQYTLSRMQEILHYKYFNKSVQSFSSGFLEFHISHIPTTASYSNACTYYRALIAMSLRHTYFKRQRDNHYKFTSSFCPENSSKVTL